MSSIQICGLALLATVCISVVKKASVGFELPVRGAAAAVFFSLIIGMATPIVSYARELMSTTPLSRWQGVLMGALGITLITHLASEICRECGEQSIAGFAELAGKVEILLLCLPLVKELLGEVEALVL